MNRDVFQMMIPNVRCGLDFDQPPATISTPMQNVHLYENAAVLEHTFEDRRNLAVRDQLSRDTDGFIQPAVATNTADVEANRECEAARKRLFDLFTDGCEDEKWILKAWNYYRRRLTHHHRVDS